MAPMNDIDAYPLSWPTGWKQTAFHRRKQSRYQVSRAKARDDLFRELRLLGARNVVLSTNIPTNRNGIPYATGAQPDNPGVAVYWTQGKKQHVMACDAWRKVEENLRAVGLAVGALRQIGRTGASEILEHAFTGFAALPPSREDDDLWWCRELGLADCSRFTEEDVFREYKRLSLLRHPDTGGSNEAMSRLNQARDAALTALGLR
jgi:hypothetical protein